MIRVICIRSLIEKGFCKLTESSDVQLNIVNLSMIGILITINSIKCLYFSSSKIKIQQIMNTQE